MLSITVYYVGGVSQETDEEHPDWSHLQRAFDAMVGANSRINEFKRRKDLGKLNMTSGNKSLNQSYQYLL